MKTIVVYKSKYGHTGKYAKLIASRLDADLFSSGVIGLGDIKKYDTIVFGGGIYASGIAGLNLIKNNMKHLKDKNIVVFTVGLTNPSSENEMKKIVDRSFTSEMKEKVKVFHLRGGMDYKKLSILHSLGMYMMKTIVSKKADNLKTEDDLMRLKTYGEKIDFFDKDSIDTLVVYTKKLAHKK